MQSITCSQLHTVTHSCVQFHTDIHTDRHTCTHTCMHTHTNIYIYMYCIYIYIYVCVCVWRFLKSHGGTPIHFFWIFHEIKHPAIGVPPYTPNRNLVKPGLLITWDSWDIGPQVSHEQKPKFLAVIYECSFWMLLANFGLQMRSGFFSDLVMAALRYLNNFVYEEPIPQLGGTGHATEEEIEEKETQASSYVAESEGTCSATFGEMSREPQPTRSANKGSRGHPVFCRRACIRFAKGDCELGDACSFCHHEHPRYVTPYKPQRRQLNHMDPWSLLLCFLFVAAHWSAV